MSDPPGDGSAPTRRRALWLAATGSALSATGASLVAVALPTLARDFGVPLERASALMVAYSSAVTVCLLPAGWLGDRLGHVRLARAGFAAFIACAALLAIAPTFAAMVALRAVQGAAASLLMASLPAWLTSVTAPAERGRALGAAASATYAGLLTGPVIGGALVGALGPRGVFACLAPLGALGLGLALREPTPRAGLGGAGAVRGGHAGLLPRALLGQRAVLLGVAAAFMQYASIFAATFGLAFLLQDERGLSPARAGLLVAVQPLVMVVVAPIAGRLSDTHGTRAFTVTGMGLTAIAVLALRASVEDAPLARIAGCLALLGLGSALFTSPNNASLFNASPPGLRGATSGIVALARNAGMAAGLACGAQVLVRVAGAPHPHGPGFVVGYRAALLVAALLACLGACASAVRVGARGP